MISNLQYWLFMGATALLATAMTRYGLPGAAPAPFELTPHTAAALAAGTAILLTLPAIVVIPWRQLQATRRKLTNTPLYAGTVLLTLLVFAAFVGAAAGSTV